MMSLKFLLVSLSLLAPATSMPRSDALCKKPADLALKLEERQRSSSGSSINMLQLVKAPRQKFEPVDEVSQAERLYKAYPLAWIHIPKCGSSINNLLIHLPGACPGVPDDTTISVESYGVHHNEAFKAAWLPLDPHGACQNHFYSWGNHDGVGDRWDEHYKGHAFMLLRQPEQRIMSGYSFGFHSWPREQPPGSALEYAQVIQGCAVRILTRNGHAPEVTCGGKFDGPVTPQEVALALDRLRTGFVFVGLTDMWGLSVCLAHRIFGGTCRTSDFIDGRVTNRQADRLNSTKPMAKIAFKPEIYDTSPLGGFRDPYDGALYEAAKVRFKSDLERYKVSMESCQPCFEAAGISMDTPEVVD